MGQIKAPAGATTRNYRRSRSLQRAARQGHDGQNPPGGGVRLGFEGGQMPCIERRAELHTVSSRRSMQ